MKIIIVNRSIHSFPVYSTDASAGIDLRANLKKAEWVSVDNLVETGRVAGGFGHTGKI